MKLRKNLLFASLLAAGAAWADTSTPLIMKTPNEYYITANSRNGKWACGVFSDYSSDSYAFRWNLESGEIELLNPSSQSTAFAVSDNGTVVGLFTDNTYRSNGATVQLAGYWDGKKWVRLEMPTDFKVIYSNAYDISPDGHYITGTVQKDVSTYYGYVWKDGKIDHKLKEDRGQAMPYAISPDGSMAAGWVWGDNRNAVIWDAQGNWTSLSNYQSMWSSGRKFSADGSKLLYYGGWEDDGNGNYGIPAIYNTATKEKTMVYATDKTGDHSLDFMDISNKGTVVGTQDERAYIYKDNTAYYAEDYLKDKGIDLSKEHILVYDGTDYYQLTNTIGISSDDNVMGFRFYNDDKDANTGEYSVSVQSMVVKFNQQTSNLAPASVKASQLSGIHSVKLTWLPNVSAQGITGYNIYRDNNKVATANASDRSFIDNNVANGEHKYSISAVYGSSESAKSEEATVTVADRALQAPTAILAQQHGYNSAHLEWGMPETNFSSLTYFNRDGADIETFGVGYDDVTYETAIKFDQSTLAAYTGQKITAVGFYPIEAQNGWTVNIYTYDANGNLQLLKSQPVTQELNYGARNVVTLSEPVDIPAGDLVIATQVNVAKASQSINTLDYGRAVKGYSDLVRESTDADFYSMGETMETMGYDYSASWGIDAVVSPVGSDLTKDNIDHYNVYADGNKAGESKDYKFDLANLSDGTHNIGVSAVYANGSESAQNATELNIKSDDEKLEAVNNVKVDNTSYTAIKASWTAPIDRDKINVQYCGETASDAAVVGPSDNNYGLMASALYPSKTFRGHNGYKITSVRFYPLNDATFTAYIYKNGELVNQTDIYDYTLNQWNEVELSEPVEVDSKASYQLVIDCYDVTPKSPALAVDTESSVIGYSDLVCVDGQGSSWDTLNNSVIFNSWMIGLGIENPDAAPLPVSGYDVNIDGVKKNSDKLTDTSYSYDFGAPSDEEHNVSVDVYYTVKSESVKGGATKFYIGSTGINGAVVGKIEMRQGDNELTVTGDNVTSVDIIAANGASAASAKGNTVSLNGLTSGVYVVKATVNGKTITRKIVIKK